MNRDKISSIAGELIEKIAKVMTNQEYEDFMEKIDEGTLPNVEYLGNGNSHRTIREYLDMIAEPGFDEDDPSTELTNHHISEYQGMQSELHNLLVNEHPGQDELNKAKAGLLLYLRSEYNMSDTDEIVNKFIEDLV